MVVGRFPAVVFLFALIDGAAPLLILAVTALAALPAIGFYRFMLGLLREQRVG